MNAVIFNLRKELHQYPDLSGTESKTASRIRAFIEKYHPTHIIENFGGAGLAAVYEYSTTGGPTVTIRCELDALPIVEENNFSYRSKVNGVSHKCGHDGHMTIVAGLIFWLKDQTFNKGKVVLLFQPAEETGKGAYKVLEDPRFQALNTDFMFALHNIPGEPLHSIITMDKGFSAEVLSFAIALKGKKSHAAEPENGINPANGISAIISALSELNVTDPLDENYAVLTPVFINMGEKSYGISPANGELHYTIRTWSTEKMDVLKARLNEIFEAISQANYLTYDVDWFEYFPASQNDQACNDLVIRAAKANNFEIVKRPYPFKFGEDFGWFSKNYKTAMFGLGSGLATPALHNADYDFPDDIIETGISMFKTIILGMMND